MIQSIFFCWNPIHETSQYFNTSVQIFVPHEAIIYAILVISLFIYLYGVVIYLR